MPVSTGAASASLGRPDRIDHGDRPPAHGGNVRDVHHDAAPSGKPRIARDELVHEAFDREQQKAVAVRDRGAIVADRRRRTRADSPSRAATAAMSRLAAMPAARAQLRGKFGEGDGAEHQAAFFGNDRNPVSASAIGG